MNRAINLFLHLACILLFLSASCASTKLTSTWVDSTYKGENLKNVLVVGVSDNLGKRKMFEEEFVRRFKSHGVEAVSSAAVIPQDKELIKDTIKGEAENLRIEVIFVTHLIGVEEKTVSFPMTTYVAPHGPRFGIYYPVISDRAKGPNFDIKEKRVKLESRLFEVKTEKMIWAVTSESFDPKSAEDVIESLSQLVMKNLRENNLIR